MVQVVEICVEDKELIIMRSNATICWRPGDARNQALSSHGFELDALYEPSSEPMLEYC